MSEKNDPTKAGNNQPLQGELGGRVNDSDLSRSPVIPEGRTGGERKDIRSLVKKYLCEPAIENLKWFFELLGRVLDGITNQILRFVLFVLLVYAGLVGWFFSSRPAFGFFEVIVVVVIIIPMIVLVLSAIKYKETVDRRDVEEKRKIIASGLKIRDESLIALVKGSVKELEANYKRLTDGQKKLLPKARRISNEILRKGNNDKVSRNEFLKLNIGDEAPNIFFEKRELGNIYAKYPWKASTLFAVAHVQEENKKKGRNNWVFNIDAPPPSGNSQLSNWWSDPWNEVVFYVAHLGGKVVATNLVIDLIADPRKKGDEYVINLILACKIVITDAPVNNNAILSLLQAIKDYLSAKS